MDLNTVHGMTLTDLRAAREKISRLETELDRLRGEVRVKALEWGRTAQEVDAIVYP